METKENIKVLLGLKDSKQDELLDIIIKNTESRLLSKLPFNLKEVPDNLSFIVEEVAVKRYNRIGSEGMTTESVEGRTNTFQANDFDEYQSIIDELYPKENGAKGSIKFY
ncbi:phage head-tail connector protein [Staphylococcus aureus]|uniref:Phage head-tail connector protein n=1 Tax=Staphylococcus aureus TaxID=1280 RepID=A0A6B3ISB4_STAAU|nr:phage head-tail connector protein [Staphylococcus aureus]NDR33025.1 phage head-tail connector protein [Staphylococcus aureus]NEE68442.1 phage head-tail connector protein [Staphylococcus aureus]NEF40711.1 phage head-tail connector protein [Staphylococcus aureus]HDZ8686829.1 phage head-tail connector protein [Staphylococcus aureus]HED8493709.1 phage head-tail connector protein [Staphylococcus aureus]